MNSEDLKISSRIRLARNIDGYSFPHKLTIAEANALKEEVKDAFFREKHLLNEFTYIDLNNQSKNKNLSLYEKNLISDKLLINRDKAGVILSKNEEVSLMINEEDHIRLQTFSKDKDLWELYKDANLYDDLMEGSLKFAYLEDLGYLTACPSNLGTALRASIMVHLPVLTKLDKIGIIARKIAAMGMTIRGIYGEGSQALGSIYQISNEVSLGISEEFIIENIEESIKTIIDFERQEEENLILLEKLKVEDTVYRSLGILTSARILSSKESLDLLSNLRFASVNNLIEISPKLVDEITIKSRDGNLTCDFLNDDYNESDLLKLRAAFIRNKLEEYK